MERNRSGNRAQVLAAIALRQLGHHEAAEQNLRDLLEVDPLDFWAQAERTRHGASADAFFEACRNDAQTLLDLVFDYASCGDYEFAAWLLDQHHKRETHPVAVPNPMERNIMTRYARAWLCHRSGKDAEALEQLQALVLERADYFFPSRLEELEILDWVLRCVEDSHAACALGHFCYDRKRHREAIQYWKQAVEWRPDNALAWRNLGIALWNIERDAGGAREAYSKAVEFAPDEARLIAEFAQLRGKLGDSVASRLEFVEAHREQLLSRDDACVEWATLLNDSARPQEALDLLLGRRFHPWEGGEGKVLRQYSRARLRLGQEALDQGQPGEALQHFELALDTPENLGEAYHLLQAKADVNYWRGRALRMLGREQDAVVAFRAAAEEGGDFRQMAVTAHSELSCDRVLALQELGETEAALNLLEEVRAFAKSKKATPAKIDYFATSLPNLLVFEDDLEAVKNLEADQLLERVEQSLQRLEAWTMPVQRTDYGRLPDGRRVSRYSLAHRDGQIAAEILDYGAIVASLRVPGGSGKKVDVCLGLSSLEDHLAGNAYMGAIVGQVAGRVSDGGYRSGDQSFDLSRNEPPNHLHGGFSGLSHKLWNVEAAGDEGDTARLRLSCQYADGEEGYPGNLNVVLTYTLTSDCGLRIEIEATSDATTLFAPTSHAYFNLSGGAEPTVDAHRLWIDAEAYVPVDGQFRLQGTTEPAIPGVNDFRSTLRLGDVMREVLPTHGDMYVLRSKRRLEPGLVARVEHPGSGLGMEVHSTEPCLQLYTGKFLDAETVPAKDGKAYPAYAGLCLECQGYPDSPFDGVQDAILPPGTTFRSCTEYRFMKHQP